jgi:hypothetical protein
MAMMAMTTRSSIKVNAAGREEFCLFIKKLFMPLTLFNQFESREQIHDISLTAIGNKKFSHVEKPKGKATDGASLRFWRGPLFPHRDPAHRLNFMVSLDQHSWH